LTSLTEVVAAPSLSSFFHMPMASD